MVHKFYGDVELKGRITMGSNTWAKGDDSFCQGGSTNNMADLLVEKDAIVAAWTDGSNNPEESFSVALGLGSHTEGLDCLAQGNYSHAEGERTYAKGVYSHTEGQEVIVMGPYSHAEGYQTAAMGECAHAEGYQTTATGNYSHAEGDNCNAKGKSAHAEGYHTNANGEFSHAEGVNTTADRAGSHAEGEKTAAKGNYSHAEGYQTQSIGNYSHAEGSATQATDDYSHAEGFNTKALGYCSHAEGVSTEAYGHYSHAEGSDTKAKANYSHAEGNSAQAVGEGCHAEGFDTFASGMYSHAEGSGTMALGDYAHAEGEETTAATAQLAIGRANKGMPGHGNNNTGTAFVIGNGSTVNNTTSNAFRVDYLGEVYCAKSYHSNGADYAEMFEWEDKNIDKEDRRGYFVTIVNEKIKIAQPGDYILGITSSTATILGNNPEDWNGRYIRDKFGCIIIENGEYKQNPDYDPNQTYIERDKRKEWAAIGMLGVLHVRDDGTCQVNGYCKVADGGIATAAETGYRVIARTAEDVVKIIFK